MIRDGFKICIVGYYCLAPAQVGAKLNVFMDRKKWELLIKIINQTLKH